MDVEKVREWLAAESRASEHQFTREVTAAALAELDAARARLAVVWKLHQPLKEAPTWCGVCVDEDNVDQDWPCETILALGAVPAATAAPRCPNQGIGDHDCVEHGDTWPPSD